MARSPEQYTVKLTIGDAGVEVTGDRRGVIEIAKELAEVLRTGRPRLELPPGPPVDEGPAPPDAEEASPAPEPLHEHLATNPRELFAQKRPSTMTEAAVVATYYLTEIAPGDDRLESIDKQGLEEVFRLAGRRLPSRSDQLLVDTYKAGFLNRVGTGKYALNNVGHNLVVHTLGSEQ